MYTCALQQKYKTSESKKSERGRAIKTMCLGQCHAAAGARKERWQGDFASLHVGSGFQSGREVTKN